MINLGGYMRKEYNVDLECKNCQIVVSKKLDLKKLVSLGGVIQFVISLSCAKIKVH